VETLAQYVTRIMKQKGLSSRDVETRSGRKIGDAYVHRIMTGDAVNPSVGKLKALALGLAVTEDEVFKVARGVPAKERPASYNADPWPPNVLLRAMERIVSSPELTRAVKLLLAQPPDKLRRLLRVIEKEAE